jgi:hypothetical protein
MGKSSNRREDNPRKGRPIRKYRTGNLYNKSTGRSTKMGRGRMGKDRGVHKGPGDIKIGRRGCPNPLQGENEVTYVTKFRLTKIVKDETHEWTMIELRKKDKS